MELIRASLIIEILGRPKEHLLNSLVSLIDKLSSETGVFLKEKDIKEPVEVKDSKDLFTTFAELTIEFATLEDFIKIIFAYMPSHIEVIYPEKITMKNFELGEIAGKIIQRMHTYDAIAKRLIVDRELLHKNANNNTQPIVNEKKEKGKKSSKKKNKN